MTKTEHITYWQRQALDDWETADVLYKGRKYLQSLFWLHLSIEKLCKALWISTNEGNAPPRTHNLNRLLAETDVDIPDDYAVLLTELNRFQLEGRYPDYVSDAYKTVTNVLVEEYIERVNPLKAWLINLLPSN